MKYFAITFPNHTTLHVKGQYTLSAVLHLLLAAEGLTWHGTIYNPKSFLTLNPVYFPDDREKRVAQSFYDCLVWSKK